CASTSLTASARNSGVYVVDFMFSLPLTSLSNGSVRKSQATSTLLRTHIDTALRFSAAWLVSEPHQFAIQVIGGTEIRKMKDRNGQLLTDKYLYECMSTERPWLPTVYKELSGYIHFSGSHVISSINSMDGDCRVSFLASEQDLDYPEESWLEAIGCFRESTEILVNYLHGYATTKGMSPTQFAEAREIFMSSRSI
ncbi:hypothetical protein, partial [Duganella aceris]|uniref:hypothetical protein n=1 Tax=Duganella aceris TaxID=2703883 RepID=UPI001A955C4C